MAFSELCHHQCTWRNKRGGLSAVRDKANVCLGTSDSPPREDREQIECNRASRTGSAGALAPAARRVVGRFSLPGMGAAVAA